MKVEYDGLVTLISHSKMLLVTKQAIWSTLYSSTYKYQVVKIRVHVLYIQVTIVTIESRGLNRA